GCRLNRRQGHWPTGVRRWPPARPQSAPHGRPLMCSQGVLSRTWPLPWRAFWGRLLPRFYRVFWPSLKFLIAQPYRALAAAASGLNERASQRCNWDRGGYSPREFAPDRSRRPGAAGPFPSCSRNTRMLITPAYAQAAAGGDANSMLMSLLPFAL